MPDESEAIEEPDQGTSHQSSILERLREHEPVARRVLLTSAVYALPLLVLTKPVLDPDIWWHLRTGDWILEHGQVPTTDPFSTYGEGKAWSAYSWLFEVGAALLHRSFGLHGILLFRFLLVYPTVIALHVLITRREPRFDRAMMLFSACSIAMLAFDSERPWHFSIFFTLLTLQSIRDIRSGRRGFLVLALPFVFGLWSNLHVEFVYGLGLLGLASLCECVELIRSRDWECRRRFQTLASLLVACFIATGFNPYGYGVYRPITEYAGHTVVFSLIGELNSPPFRSINDWFVLGLGVAAAYTIGFRRERSLFPYSVLLVGFYLSFRSVRDAWMLVLAALFILTAHTSETAPPDSERFDFTTRRVSAVACVWLIFLCGAMIYRPLTQKRLRAAIADKFPEAAAAYLEKAHPGVPVYNRLDSGGFLIWRLPDRKVVIDGRTNLHGDGRILKNCEIYEASSVRKTDPEFLAARLIVAERQLPIVEVLRLDPGFEILHEDPVAVVFGPKRRP